MKRYLIQIVLIGLLFALVIGLVFFIYYHRLYNSSFKIEDNKNILILGDSYTEHSIDDRIFFRSKNVSAGATSYPFLYLIAKRTLKDNPQIDTLLLSFHSGAVSARIDSTWIAGTIFDVKVRTYICFADMKTIIQTKNTDIYLNALKSPKMNSIRLGTLLKKDINAFDLEIGSYVPLDSYFLEKDILLQEKEETQTLKGFNGIDTTTIQYKYLKKIEQLCSDRDVKLILINTPTYQPEKYHQHSTFDSLRKVYLPDIPFLDFASFLIPDSCFGDIVHLNYKGAEIFSRHLQSFDFSEKQNNIGNDTVGNASNE